MRRRTTLREARLVHAAVGASILAVPASVAVADPPADASAPDAGGPSASVLQARVKSHQLRYGQDVVVLGQAPSADAEQTITLEYAPAPASSWQTIASARIGSSGSFRLSARLRSSGWVRVSQAPSPAGPGLALGASPASASSTAPQRVAVSAAIRLHRRKRSVWGAGRLALGGRLLAGGAHHRVLLQGWRDGRWFTLASSRTGPGGWFQIRYLAAIAGQETLRVHFAGDRSNAAVSARAGRLAVYRQTTASWYDDGGTTACGFHAFYGVANLSLPCGAKVSFSYGGRTVTATVDDRGPYVGGREWDLNQNTASALGFQGVGTVWSSG